MPNYWLLSCGKDGELWPTFWNEKIVALGWSAIGDLQQYQDRQKLTKALRLMYPKDKPGQTRTAANQLWSFFNLMQKGELVFVRSYGAIIGIGEVQGGYEFVLESNTLRKKLYSPFFDEYFPNIRRVRWLSLWGGLKQPLALTRLTLM